VNYKKLLIILLVLVIGVSLIIVVKNKIFLPTPTPPPSTSSTTEAPQDPLAKWAPDFDPEEAKYKCVVSNVSHPVIIGVMAGFEMRDELWKRTNGQIYFDYKPLSILGGEVEVLNMLQMGAVQGMGVSSVASTNMGPRMGLANLPFLLDTYEKLDKFMKNQLEKRNKRFLEVFENTGDLKKLSQFFSSCVNCYNCRAACPVCFCRECVFNTDVFDYEPFQYTA